MRSIGTDGIILKKYVRGENDQSLVIFSPELGKIRATARGAKKCGSSLSGHIETLNICRFQLHKSQHGYTVTQCQAIRTFRPLRDNLKKSLLAIFLLEIVQKSTLAQEQGHDLYSLIENTLDALEKHDRHSLIIESFIIRLSNLLGVMPDTERCSSCHRKWTEKGMIFLGNNHLTCFSCRQSADTKEIPFNIIKLINYICKNSFEAIIRIRLSLEELEQLRKISRQFLEGHLEREILTEKLMAGFN